jgi:4-diphosphocytidyl-2-C-methyl-D-erythritol kinase
MKKELQMRAYAKINLYLELLGVRENGYHEIDTVMQTVGLFDKVTLCYDPEGSDIVIGCNKRHIPTDKGNIAYKCAERFFEKTGKSGGLSIYIEKKIPVAAGLGGGSADGAAVLRGLDRLCGTGLSVKELCAIGETVGADIPFCIRGGCVRATGIGEIFSPAESLSGFVPVIAMGKQGSSTPLAYRAIDEAGYRPIGDARNMLSALEKKDQNGVTASLYNAFEQVILQTNPEARLLKEHFIKLGAAGALMSGSGAAVFGLFDEESDAKRGCEALRELGFFAVVAPIVQQAGGN